jgi:hypothetical protein
MRVRYSVTFEFDVAPPITYQGTVAATSMPTCFARATREAVKAHPGLRWSSMVCVLLERVEAADQTTDANEAARSRPSEGLAREGEGARP